MVLAGLVLVLSVRNLAHRAEPDAGEIPKRELFFLLMPAFNGLVVYNFTGLAMQLLVNPVLVEWSMHGSLYLSMTLYILIPVLTVVMLLCILYAYECDLIGKLQIQGFASLQK